MPLRMFSYPKILFLVSLIQSLPFEFLIFFIILVCLLFIHAKNSYNNILVGVQNVTGAYVIKCLFTGAC